MLVFPVRNDFTGYDSERSRNDLHSSDHETCRRRNRDPYCNFRYEHLGFRHRGHHRAWITVSVNPEAATVTAGSTTQLTATVTNDSTGKGVTWGVPCSAAQCGAVSPATTVSGAPTTYTAPSTTPGTELKVTVTATSVANTGASGFVTITVPTITISVTRAGPAARKCDPAIHCTGQQRSSRRRSHMDAHPRRDIVLPRLRDCLTIRHGKRQPNDSPAPQSRSHRVR